MPRDFLKEMQERYARVVSEDTGEKKKVAMSFCPTTWNQPCKLCEACKEVLFHQDKHTAQQIEQVREINRKPKFYANVVLASNPKEVLLFEYGKTIGDKLEVYEGSPGGDLNGFTHPKNGRNMVIVRYPNPDKRKTRYDVEPKVVVTPLNDMDVLDRLHNLDDVPQLLKNGVQPLYQSKLTAQRTELRWLPFWDWRNHPELASVFQVHYYIHYHISEDELAAINRGEFNPVNDILGIAVPVQKAATPAPTTPFTTTPIQIGSAPQASVKGGSLWDDLMVDKAKQEKPTPQPQPQVGAEAPKGAKPGCFGTCDEDPVCTTKCAPQGWLDACRAETAASLERRKQARGLYK